MIPLLTALGADPAFAMLLADGGGGVGAIGIAFPFLAGPAVFIGVYLGIYRRYRNTDKRHKFEKETEVAVGNLETVDHRRGSNNRQRSRRMRGDNSTDHLQRVRRLRVE